MQALALALGGHLLQYGVVIIYCLHSLKWRLNFSSLSLLSRAASPTPLSALLLLNAHFTRRDGHRWGRGHVVEVRVRDGWKGEEALGVDGGLDALTTYKLIHAHHSLLQRMSITLRLVIKRDTLPANNWTLMIAPSHL